MSKTSIDEQIESEVEEAQQMVKLLGGSDHKHERKTLSVCQVWLEFNLLLYYPYRI